MKSTQPSRLHFALSWLILLTIISTSVSHPTLFDNAEFEDSIELEKKIEDGEKKIEALLLQTFHYEQIVLEHKLVSIFHFCEVRQTTRSAKKLYLLFHQIKSHLG